MQGLQIATVSKLSSEEPGNENKIEVSISNFTPEEPESYIWAAVSCIPGVYFFPEIGDKVLLGFLGNDQNKPVILGSLFPNRRDYKIELSNTNYQKNIVSNAWVSLLIDDETKILQLKTPASNSIELRDVDKTIEIKDQNGNSIKMSEDGIELSSSKNISIKSQGDISLNATGKIEINSQNDIALKGTNIAHAAQVGFSAKGNASAELSASGQTIIKGTMVQIN